MSGQIGSFEDPVNIETGESIYFCQDCNARTGKAVPQSRFIPGGNGDNNVVENKVKCMGCEGRWIASCCLTSKATCHQKTRYSKSQRVFAFMNFFY